MMTRRCLMRSRCDCPSLVRRAGAVRCDGARRTARSCRRLRDRCDTIAVQGKTVRLVGFDAPELGRHAHCGIERMLAVRAISRLRQIIRTGDDIDYPICSLSTALAGPEPKGRGGATTARLPEPHDRQ